MSEDTTRKARGMYNRIYGCDRAFYEYIMQEKSFIKSLEKFTIKELSYLTEVLFIKWNIKNATIIFINCKNIKILNS